MTTPILTFFNNKGGVGKTSLVYHLSWMFAELGKRVVVADLDPQANLTAAFLDDYRIEEIWDIENTNPTTIYRCVEPLTETGSYQNPVLTQITDNLHLIPGDVKLSLFEDALSDEWPRSLDTSPYRAMLISSSFWHVIQLGAKEADADIVLVDIGPNLGAINRSVLIAADYVVIPLGADLFSLQGLRNLGPTLKIWKGAWGKRLANWEEQNSNSGKQRNIAFPDGKMEIIGYLCQQYGTRLDRPVKAYDKWVKKIPAAYREAIGRAEDNSDCSDISDDPYCLSMIKHYRSLVPLAQESRKPIFRLKAADGAVAGHIHAVAAAREDFERLAKKIAGKINLPISEE